MNKFINSLFNKNQNNDDLLFLENFPKIKVHKTINEIDKESWNNLIGKNNPFIEYEFFKALEISNSIGEKSGWLCNYLALYEQKKLVGVIPLFTKYNSYGEYIFDWSWASAYSQNGLDYYPKFTVAVPFTPATGKRIFIHPDYDFKEIADQLVDCLFSFAKSINVSSIHWLFTEKEEMDYLITKGFMSRYTHQFHWKNYDYNSFDDFLAEFTSKKRNQIKRERKQAKEGITIEIVSGNDLKPLHWQAMYNLYISTTYKKWATDYLTKEFFEYIAKNFYENAVIVFAKKDNNYIAGALNFRKGDHLYGRYWGSLEEQQCLHFEICYYQSIEYAIKEKISLFEAGAQGEHKLQRGFLAEYTYSVHWFAEPQFSNAIQDYLRREKRSMDKMIQEYREDSPFKT